MRKIIGILALPALTVYLAPDIALPQQDREYQPVSKVAPVYPEQALAESLEGHVVVEYTITERGTVEDAQVAESTNSIFDEAAIESVRKFRYDPRILDGKPVAVAGVRVRVLFRLPVEH
jgi:protein TonB